EEELALADAGGGIGGGMADGFVDVDGGVVVEEEIVEGVGHGGDGGAGGGDGGPDVDVAAAGADLTVKGFSACAEGRAGEFLVEAALGAASVEEIAAAVVPDGGDFFAGGAEDGGKRTVVDGPVAVADFVECDLGEGVGGEGGGADAGYCLEKCARFE